MPGLADVTACAVTSCFISKTPVFATLLGIAIASVGPSTYLCCGPPAAARPQPFGMLPNAMPSEESVDAMLGSLGFKPSADRNATSLPPHLRPPHAVAVATDASASASASAAAAKLRDATSPPRPPHAAAATTTASASASSRAGPTSIAAAQASPPSSSRSRAAPPRLSRAMSAPLRQAHTAAPPLALPSQSVALPSDSGVSLASKPMHLACAPLQARGERVQKSKAPRASTPPTPLSSSTAGNLYAVQQREIEWLLAQQQASPP